MLSKTGTLRGYKLLCLDGAIGKVDEFYFDDRHWTIRYLIANTRNWLSGRQVLISPYALQQIDPVLKQISVDLTKKQIEESPSLNTHKPVSRQFEEAYYGHYGWPTYWDGPHLWGSSTAPERDREKRKALAKVERGWDRHLRSSQEVIGYHIQALDGEVGHLEDFVMDDSTWAIRYLIVATRNWLPGKKVLISPQWIDKVSWVDSKVIINLSRDLIRQSPEYTEEALVTRDYETGLYRHYDRKAYWIDEMATV